MLARKSLRHGGLSIDENGVMWRYEAPHLVRVEPEAAPPKPKPDPEPEPEPEPDEEAAHAPRNGKHEEKPSKKGKFR